MLVEETDEDSNAAGVSKSGRRVGDDGSEHSDDESDVLVVVVVLELDDSEELDDDEDLDERELSVE